MKSVCGAALGLIIAACFTMATPASAQTHWMNADTSRGTMVLSVAGKPNAGPSWGCTGTSMPYPPYTAYYQDCFYEYGYPIIVWPWSNTVDQVWFQGASGGVSPGIPQVSGGKITGRVVASSVYLSVGAGSTQMGAAVIDWAAGGGGPNLSQDQVWSILPAETFAAPFPGCFVFVNTKTGYVMGVAGGSVVKGGKVIVWELIRPGVQDTHWHPDQFWCPF